MATIEVAAFTLDFPSTPANGFSILNVDLILRFGEGYIIPPTAVLPCYPPNTPNSMSLEARVVENDILRVGLRNNTGSPVNPGAIDITFIFLRE